jgi:cyclopropane-fatty-acyl-phospholipid synthase
MAVETTHKAAIPRRTSSPARRLALARSVVAIVARTIPARARVRLELDPGVGGDMPTIGSARARVRINGPDAVARLFFPPSPDAFAEGYLRGDLDIDGDVGAAIEVGQSLDFRRLRPTDFARLARDGLELRRGRSAAPPLRRIARVSGRRHSRARDLAAVRFHYDVGEAFYSLWLDRRLAYSCALFERADDPAADLDAAQEAKLDRICRKLRLEPGQRLLDIGCGWGSLILFAAERYGVEAVGVTLSERQAGEANRRAAAAGLQDRARALVRDYRDLGPLGTFDAVASVGMFEHVGATNLRTYFEAAQRALKPGGLFLNHGIATAEAKRTRGSRHRNSRFVERYVFPDGELVPVEKAISVARDEAGFELLDVELLRPHYALTLRAWVQRLERNWDAAVSAAGTEVARTWRLYMSGARIGFERGDLDVAQLLLGRPQAEGSPVDRPLRPWW